MISLAILKKGYPYTGDIKSSFKTIVFISSFIFLFVLFFRSDQITQNGAFINRLSVSFYFGLMTFLGASLNSIVVDFFINSKKEKEWKVWNEFLLYLLHFLTISILLFFLTAWVAKFEFELNLLSLINTVFSTVLVGIIPVSFHILNEQKKLYKKNYELASKLNPRTEQRAPNNHSPVIRINDFQTPVSSILYIESNKNYVDISLADGRKITVRKTLKELEKELNEYPELVRCHRAFIVNLKRIKEVGGNAQGLKLFLIDYNSFIPVSRSYIPKLNSLLQ